MSTISSVAQYVLSCSPEESRSPALWVSWADKILSPVISGLIIAYFGGVFLFRVNDKYTKKREHLLEVSKQLRDQLESLIILTSVYWSNNYDVLISPPQEAEIEYKINDISTLSELCAANLFKEFSDRGPDLVGRLISEIVTPSFATAFRVAEPYRPAVIARAAAALASEVALSRMNFVKGAPWWLNNLFGYVRAKPDPS